VTSGLDPRERESILHDLCSADEEVRRLAVERGVLLPASEALPMLAERLGDPSWRVRKAAVEALAVTPEDWPVAQHLIASLADGENPGRRNAAVEALVRIGRRMVVPLLEATESPDVDVRKLVVDALAGIGSERATPRLAALLGDADANVRGAAADALAALGGIEAQRALRTAALREDEETLVRFAALRGLARLEAPLRASDLASAISDPMLRAVAFGVLGRVSDPEGEEVLLKGLESGSRATREAAIEALLRVVAHAETGEADRLCARLRSCAETAPGAVSDAMVRLGEADLSTRILIAQFLGIVAVPEAALPLLCAARDDEALAEVALGALTGLGAGGEAQIDAAWSTLDGDLQLLACQALGRGRGARGAARLVLALDEADPTLRAAAARAVAGRGDTSAASALVRRLQLATDDFDPDAELERGALIDALVRITAASPDADARRAVTDLLASSFEGASESVRLAIARVLGSVGAGDHASLMALLAQDPSPAVRRAAVAALAGLRGEARREALRLALADEAAAVRIAAAAAFGDTGEAQALGDLERLLVDEDADVRAAAVRAIGDLAQAVAAEAGWDAIGALLGSALGDRGPVALAAVEVFERVAPALPIERVCAVLDHEDPEVVQGALACIRRHGRESELTATLPLLSHPHWAVRAGAIEAIAERRFVAAVPAILRRLDGEEDEFVRGTLLRALERLEEA
jgi:HEAT repeat protein